MKNNILFIVVVIFTSCRSVAVSQNIAGQYYKSGKDYQYNLILNKDNSFALTQKYFDVNSMCQGKWQYLSADTILLNCGDEDLSARLERGYMTERQKKIIVLGQNKLKLGAVILKRKKE
ncbi:hypothetical protein CLV51_1082 [Chitinophaga niastensis]|uniref:NlpE-like protein n=1 Tax=Chitinophaga niastensis TaxID=536980 RepID=A0A2P8HAR0_CHINA|nr:hypothetical protein [Chitinophaga niastensis]PSL43313.1 hypothetical protein CLV51_1082 [Chitinophaga niastensis]